MQKAAKEGNIAISIYIDIVHDTLPSNYAENNYLESLLLLFLFIFLVSVSLVPLLKIQR